MVVQNEQLSGLTQMLNLFGGGGLKKASIFAIGISPYITAQIIIQLLSNDLVRPLSELKKMGESGRYKMELYTRLLTLPFSIMTSLGTLHVLSFGNNVKFKNLFDNSTVGSFLSLPTAQKAFMVILFVAGTYATLFLSDIISKKGLGNGITLIIMSGIISSLPENFYEAFKFFKDEDEEMLWISRAKFIFYLLCYFITLVLIIFINSSVKKIPVQQIGAGMILDKKELSYLPIKLMPAGIIPVVFAGSLMMFPVGIAELVKENSPGFSTFVLDYLSFSSLTGLGIYFFLIVLFSFFYSQIQINVDDITRNFQKQSQFIPGIKVGQPTYNYLNLVINRINWIGAPFLALVAILPNLLNSLWNIPHNVALGGTGIIILVSGTLQLVEELKSTHIVSRYQVRGNDFDHNLFRGKSNKAMNLFW